MGKFRKKPVEIEAITFDELVEHGREIYLKKGWALCRRMPWSFHYKGSLVTHENDECYLISTPEGTIKFN